MTQAWIWVGWAGIGAVCGAAVGGVAPRLLHREHRPAWVLKPPTLAATTALLFGLSAWRLDAEPALLIDSALIAVTVPAAAVDALEHRLPVVLIWPGYLAVLAAVGVGAAIQRDPAAVVRAVIGMAALAAFYGLIALVFQGGLGLGDVRLAGLLGVALGWTGWHALYAATVLTFVVGGLVGVCALAARRPRDTAIPFGPIMTGATLAVLILSS